MTGIGPVAARCGLLKASAGAGARLRVGRSGRSMLRDPGPRHGPAHGLPQGTQDLVAQAVRAPEPFAGRVARIKNGGDIVNGKHGVRYKPDRPPAQPPHSLVATQELPKPKTWVAGIG